MACRFASDISGCRMLGLARMGRIVTVLVCRVGSAAAIETLNDDLAAMQLVVDGSVGNWPLIADDRGTLVLFCNEEGELRDLPFNRVVRDGRGESRPILGDFYFGRVADSEAVSLTADDVATCRALLTTSVERA
jgi:hypothetical protein